jgi:hypothetical protein
MSASVALVMMDTRPAVLPAGTRASRVDYPQLAFELNRRYACEHGYILLYLQMRSPTCAHQDYGERHPSYCKLAAIAEALSRGYDWAVWLDRCRRHARPRLSRALV